MVSDLTMARRIVVLHFTLHIIRYTHVFPQCSLSGMFMTCAGFMTLFSDNYAIHSRSEICFSHRKISIVAAPSQVTAISVICVKAGRTIAVVKKINDDTADHELVIKRH